MKKENKDVIVNKKTFITSPLEMFSALCLIISLPCGGSTAVRRGRRVVNKYFLFGEEARRPREGVSKGFIARAVIPQACCAGYSGHSAFTLIELLVVVLIIGILAAVAVPQYQKAVWKSRYLQAKILAKSIAAAEEAYFLGNGKYTFDFNELDITIPTTIKEISCSNVNSKCNATFSWGNCTLVAKPIPGRNTIQCSVYKNGEEYLLYALSFKYGTWDYGDAICVAYGETGKPTSKDISYQICSSETNRTVPSESWGGSSDAWDYEP